MQSRSSGSSAPARSAVRRAWCPTGWARACAHLVVIGVALGESGEDIDGLFRRRLLHLDRLEAALQDKGYKIAVVNAGLSGDTTAGGLARLEWSLSDDPAAVIIVLGGNDMLRGLDPAATRTNLDAIITQLKQRNVTVMLAGMLASPNLGPEYVTAFDGLYPALAETHNIDFYPFFLEGVALDPALNLSDGLHPNEDGVNEIVRRILPYVTDMLDQMAG